MMTNEPNLSTESCAVVTKSDGWFRFLRCAGASSMAPEGQQSRTLLDGCLHSVVAPKMNEPSR
jgi:hypothetical protein